MFYDSRGHLRTLRWRFICCILMIHKHKEGKDLGKKLLERVDL